ncbi:NAD-dependent epimerase/dehydratase family protein [Flavobacterium sp. LS2R12]|uniref:NAD-dependent epimerase/dehydratase family protein n=1 Tax=unclassified Flavobacterium TaxID=196869 RepID=UPI003AAB19CF
MKILVTGANGFLGKSIVKELSKGNTLFGLSRSSGDYKVSLDNEIPIFNQKFDLVIHAAGKAHAIPNGRAENKQFFDVNVLGTRNLLQGLENTGLPEQFVFISSVSVYGQENGIQINEEHPLEAKDSYGLSKIEAEQLVLKWCEQHHVVCTILRLPLLVGANPPGNLGTMLRAMDNGYYFNIGGGKAKKSMVLVHDVVSFIPIVATVGGVYNLTDGSHPSFEELSSALLLHKNKKEANNLPLIIAQLIGYLGDLIGDKAPLNSLKLKKIISDLTFDDSKVRQLLNWNPESVVAYLKRNTI